jgi:Ca-activated chloride channel homolog
MPAATTRLDLRRSPTRPHRAALANMIALALVALALVALAPAPAAAQGWIAPPPAAAGWGIVKLRTDVTVRVNGPVAEVEVEEWFENRGRAVGEGVYLYPLPGEAVFSNFSLYQGDQELRGETMDAAQARAIYEEIVRSRRDPALIELVGHGLIRARVFPIEPGEKRRITLRYTQVLDRAGDAAQFRYVAGRPGGLDGPTTRPPRPGPLPRPQPLPMPRPMLEHGPEAGPEPRPRPEPGMQHAASTHTAPIGFTLLADAGVYGEPFSPTHSLRVERRDGQLRVRPAADLHGNFSIFLPFVRPVVGLTLATHRPSREPGYFMLTLSPGAIRAAATPRDVAVVVDVSGSMAGEKMEQTRQALHQLLGSLGRDDRFRLISFSTAVGTSADGWTRATPGELATARRWVDGLRAEGATNISGALEEAFRLPSPEARLPIVVFLTDGLPTVGERDPDKIAAVAEAARGRARVFAFGVGYDVNTYLLDRLTAAGRGSTAYVEPGQDVELAVGTLAARITHPVLTDLELAGSPVRLTEIHPVTLPDLFAGEALVLFGRYETTGRGELRVRGQRANRTETFALDARFPDRATGNDFIPRLWAARKLGELTRQVRLNGSDPELVEEIRRTALRYGLLSEYTAHLVQEPAMVAAGQRPGDGVIRLRGASPSAALAPAAVTGQAAVQSAEAARVRREVATSADLAVAEQALESRILQAGRADQADRAGQADRADRRIVAGRVFELRGDVWIQTPLPDGIREVAIQLYSGAYFALLAAAPELRPIVGALEQVTVAGERVAFRFGDEGRETLSLQEAARLTAEFRGP